MVDNNGGQVREIEFPLIGFKFSPRTNIAKKRLNNRDATLLLLAANGPTVKTNTLAILLRGWRPMGEDSARGKYWGKRELDFSYLWNHYYGHVGVDSTGKKHVPWTGVTYKGPCWWWRNTRTMRGTVQISAKGYARLAQLKHELAQVMHYIPTLDNCITTGVSEAA